MNSITFKIPFIVLIVLLLGIGFVVTYYLKSQNSTIIMTKESEIRQEAEIIYTSIKNNMLAGEAPIAVSLFRDFEKSSLAANVGLYRADGISAFSDNKTIEVVNRILGKSRFPEKNKFTEKLVVTGADFTESVKNVSDVFVKNTDKEKKSIVIYKPLLNQPKCSKCHGVDHVVRGVIRISSPLDEAYRKAKSNTVFSVILYSIVVLVLTGIIIFFLKKTVITPILSVRRVVKSVGQGDFDTKIMINRQDEISELSREINSMIDGLREKFRLSKFVSKSTLEHVKKDDDITLGGEKKELTVLFTDIRDFTKYSENKDPALVLEMLNRIMNLQAEIITSYGGDIDKFVGDEIMAVFEGDDMVYNALSAAEKIKKEIKEINKDQEMPVYVGMGVNTGEMISGNMGSQERIDRTVIGDSVNLGARLCSIAGNNTIILSEFSYEYVRERVSVVEHGAVSVKGKENKVKIYTLKNTL